MYLLLHDKTPTVVCVGCSCRPLVASGKNGFLQCASSSIHRGRHRVIRSPFACWPRNRHSVCFRCVFCQTNNIKLVCSSLWYVHTLLCARSVLLQLLKRSPRPPLYNASAVCLLSSSLFRFLCAKCCILIVKRLPHRRIKRSPRLPSYNTFAVCLLSSSSFRFIRHVFQPTEQQPTRLLNSVVRAHVFCARSVVLLLLNVYRVRRRITRSAVCLLSS